MSPVHPRGPQGRPSAPISRGLVLAAALAFPATVLGHFQELIPSAESLSEKTGSQVEVEWRNDGSVTPPTGAHVTQVIKADGQGVFSYAMPRAGWWGFAALMEGDEPMTNPEGAKVPVEQGALMWVQVHDMR